LACAGLKVTSSNSYSADISCHWCAPSGFIMDVTGGSKLFTEEVNLKNPTI
jgi:hypothetical protein